MRDTEPREFIEGIIEWLGRETCGKGRGQAPNLGVFLSYYFILSHNSSRVSNIFTYCSIISLISYAGTKYKNKSVYATVMKKICSKLTLAASMFATFGGTSKYNASC